MGVFFQLCWYFRVMIVNRAYTRIDICKIGILSNEHKAVGRALFAEGSHIEGV